MTGAGVVGGLIGPPALVVGGIPFYCYQRFSHAINGILGRGNRIDLPQCVQNMVRNTYPNENNAYTGFIP